MAYAAYLSKVQNKIKQDPKYFWKFVNSKRKKKCKPQQIKYAGVLSSNSHDAANLFAEYFKSIYSQVNLTRSLPVANEPVIDCMVLTADEIRKGMQNLNSTKSAGPDGIPNSFLKECSSALVKPLHYLFNASLEQGCFPTSWKISRIVPIHKKGSKLLAENYRSVAILSAVPKLFESLVHSHLYAAVESRISPVQHGFFKRRSIVTNLCEFTTRVTEWMTKGYQVDCVYTDMSKAFDIAGIDEIVDSASQAGIGGSLIKWLKGYLTDREQFVRVQLEYSDVYSTTSGVPQGSHLGPLLFVLLMNELPHVISEAFILIYADDVKLFFPVKNKPDCVKLQRDIDAFARFCHSQKLKLNGEKCAVITFTKCARPIDYQYKIASVPINRVTSVKDLGVRLDAAFTFNDHVNNMVAEGLSSFAVIRRFATELDDPHTIRTLYIALVRSKLEFASVVWRPMYRMYVNKLEGIQKRFVQFAVRNMQWGDYVPQYADLCKLLDLDTIESRHKMSDIIFFTKLQKGLMDSVYLRSRLTFNQSTVRLRRRRRFAVQSYRTNYARNEPANRFMEQINFIGSRIDFYSSLDNIKKKLSLFYRGQLYLV